MQGDGGKREGGFAEAHAVRNLVHALAFLALPAVAAQDNPTAQDGEKSGKGAEAGGVTVYVRVEAVDLGKPIPLAIAQAQGLKIAFQAKGKDTAEFTLHEAKLGETRHCRDGYRLTGDCWQVPGYRWAGGDWAPCLYRADLFLRLGDWVGKDGLIARECRAPANDHAEFSRLTFKAGNVQVRGLVIYRGGDQAPPEAPSGLTAQAGEDGVRLAWKPANDNVGVALYAVSRAKGDGKFAKIAQTANPEYTDKPPAEGVYRYRVLAADYERNVGPWSPPVSVRVGRGFDQPGPSSVVKDSLYYAEHVRAVHDAGAGKVERGNMLFHGDSPNYLDRTQQHVRGLVPLMPYVWVNAVPEPGVPPRNNTSSKLVKDLETELDLRPEFCVITCGIESPRETPEERRKVVDDVLKMIRMCEKQGTVPVFVTNNPYGHHEPRNSPEEKLSDALAAMCEENKVPVARVFDIFRQAQDAGEDYRKLMHPSKGIVNAAWPNGYPGAPMWPSFELGYGKRLIVIKETLDRVLFTLLDRPE